MWIHPPYKGKCLEQKIKNAAKKIVEYKEMTKQKLLIIRSLEKGAFEMLHPKQNFGNSRSIQRRESILFKDFCLCYLLKKVSPKTLKLFFEDELFCYYLYWDKIGTTEPQFVVQDFLFCFSAFVNYNKFITMVSNKSCWMCEKQLNSQHLR